MPSSDPALMGAEEMMSLYLRRVLSPVEVLEAVQARIRRLNPTLNAFAELNPRAIEEARESEIRWNAGRPRGPLDGVPCTVKDLVDLAGFPTRRGSRVSDPKPVNEDAPAVLSLKAAGAVIIGKTTTTEYGWKSPGDCPLHGITRNPWNTSRTTGGSSSGAGAAGAAGFGPLHIGTDAGGSIRIPAAWCGLVGLKPTYGRVPQWPASAFASVACLGPMARDVRDAAAMLATLARYDLRDPFCLMIEPHDWRDEIEDGVEGMLIGVLRSPGFDAPVNAEGLAAVQRAASMLSDAGAHVEEAKIQLPDTHAIFSRVWGAALSRLVAGFSKKQRAQLDPGILEVAHELGGMTAVEFMEAEARRAITAHAMARLHQCFELVLCPTVPAGPPLADAPTTNPVRALWTEWAPWTFMFNLTRQPAITVPMGRDENGIPTSVQIAAAQYEDGLVLRAARVLEKMSEPLGVPGEG